MAMMPPRRCTVCRGLVVGRCACKKPWMQSRPIARIRGERLQQLRLNLWAKDPRCQVCRRVLTLADAVRDHVVNLQAGGTDTEDNTRIVCRDCHQKKSHAESMRGREATR